MSSGLIGKKFIGKVVKGIDPDQRGRYLVHIIEGLPHMAEDKGIWCTNSIQSAKLTKSDRGTYGSYTPLHSGTTVQVAFDTDDFMAGRIVSIISDYYKKSDLEVGKINGIIPTGSGDKDGERKTYNDEELPKSKSEDRDEQYIVMSTPNKSCIHINENAASDPNSIFIVFRGKESVIRINDQGIHISTDGNHRERISINNEIVINGSSSIDVTGGNYDINVNGDVNLKSTGNINQEASGEINIKAGGDVNIDGAAVRINGGSSKSANPAKTPVCKI